MPLIKRTRVLAILKAHQPDINWGYEEWDCSCGWMDPVSRFGPSKNTDRTRHWTAHLRKQFEDATNAVS